MYNNVNTLGYVEFIDSFENKYSKEEQEKMFKEFIAKKGILSYMEVCPNGDELWTVIYKTEEEDKYIIYRDDGYEDWYQEALILRETNLLKAINNIKKER